MRTLTLPAAVLMVLWAQGGAAEVLVANLVVTADGQCICHAPMVVGIAKGIFEKDGLHIQLTYPATGVESLAALGKGAADVAAAAPTVVAQAAAHGIPLKGLFMAFGDATGGVPTDRYLAVIGRKASGLREGHLEDLKGKKIGLPRGTIAHQYVFTAFQARGLDATRDVAIQPMPPAALPGALQSGAVDAVAIWEPVATQALQATSDAVVVYRGGNHIQFFDLRVMSPRYVSTHPGTVKRYILAFAEAARYTRLHPDEATDILLSGYSKGLSRETVRSALGLLSFDPRVSKATLQAAEQGYEFAVAIGALKRAPRFAEMFDLRALTQVVGEHPELFQDLPAIPESMKL